MRRLLLATLLPVLASSFATPASAQTSVVDGPWTGWVQCVLSARGSGYQDEQVHTWRMTGAPPRVTGSIRHWPAIWSAQGSGNTATDTWIVTVPDTEAPIAMWELAPPDTSFRIGSVHGLLVSPVAVRVTGRSPGNYSLQEPAFPAIDSPRTEGTITRTRTRDIQNGPGWRKPFAVLTTETCTWNFTRTGAASAPPPVKLGDATPPAQSATASGARASSGSELTLTPIAPSPVPSAASAPERRPGGDRTPNFNSTISDPPPPSSRYRVTITNFRVIHEYQDDSLDRDGKANEVYLAAQIRVIDRQALLMETLASAADSLAAVRSAVITGGGSGSQRTTDWNKVVTAATSVRSQTFGDIGRFPARTKAGNGSPTGGLRTPDLVTLSQPLPVWEGTLSDGANAVIIEPSVWDDDGNAADFQDWITLAKTSMLSAAELNAELGTAVRPIKGQRFQPTRSARDSVTGGLNWVSDRPIGLEACSGCAYSIPAYRGMLLVLTREKLESWLGSSPSRDIAVTVADNPTGQPTFDGIYLVTLQIARVGAAGVIAP